MSFSSDFLQQVWYLFSLTKRGIPANGLELREDVCVLRLGAALSLSRKPGKSIGTKIRQRSPWILPIIIVSQFAGGSLWFSGNAILSDLAVEWQVRGQMVGYATSAVQLGFILGTLLFAWFTISDRFSPRKVFCTCTFLGAFSNSLLVLLPEKVYLLLVLRFATGVFLAGIYPVGMKIASGWYREGLGRALGFLVGALVIGTAFPHLIKGIGYRVEWQIVLLATSSLALSGGLAMLWFVPDGPYLGMSTGFNGRALLPVWQGKELRAAAFGYFGHMWELYTLWAFLPLFLSIYFSHSLFFHGSNMPGESNVSIWSFLIIAAGGVGCALGGIVSLKSRSSRVAFFQLAVSGCCCLFSPLFFSLPPVVFFGIMLLWGITVAGDSPQYSTVIAYTAPKELVGSILTLVNCIGFFITIVSIQVVDFATRYIGIEYLLIMLLPGPIFGLYSMRHIIVGRY